MEAKNLAVSSLYEAWIDNSSVKLSAEDFFAKLDEYLDSQMKEICGKCVPCRDGIPAIRSLIRTLSSENATEAQVLELEALVRNLRSSRCTIGLSVGKNLEVVLENNFDLLTSRLNKEDKR